MNETANSLRINIFCLLRVTLGFSPKLKPVLKTRSTFRVRFRVKQLIFKGENIWRNAWLAMHLAVICTNNYLTVRDPGNSMLSICRCHAIAPLMLVIGDVLWSPVKRPNTPAARTDGISR